MSTNDKHLREWWATTITKPSAPQGKWLRDMKADHYSAAPGVRSSWLKFHTLKEAKHQQEQPDMPNYALSLGSLIHMAVLEPNAFENHDEIAKRFQYSPTATLNSKGAMQLWSADPSRQLITDSMVQKAARFRDAILECDFAEELLRTKAEREVSGFVWDEEHQLHRKVRLDLLPDQPIMVDLKSTDTLNERKFFWKIKDMGWDISGAYYMDTAELIEGKRREAYFLIAVTGPKGASQDPLDEPYDCDVFEISRLEPSMLRRARDIYLSRLAKLRWAAEHWDWPGAATMRKDAGEAPYIPLCDQPPTS